MKAKLFSEAMGMVDDKYVNEAEKYTKRKTIIKKWATAAASFLLAVGLSVGGYYLVKNSGANAGGGGGTGMTYMSYNGPVFPLTSLNDANGITAERLIDYDFRLYSEASGGSRSIVSDKYILRNTTDTDQVLRLAYPVSDSLNGYVDNLPVIVVDGEEISFEIDPGPYTGGFMGTLGDTSGESTSTNYKYIYSWEGYKTLLSDDKYMQSAFDAYPTLNQNVIIYEITDYVIHGEGSNPTLNMEFYIDYDKTYVMTYGMNGGRYNSEDGYAARHFSVPAEGEYGYGDSYYIVLVGEDLESYTLQGYEDGGCDRGEEIDITAKVTRKESTLGEFIWSIIEAERTSNDESYYIGDLMSNEMYFGLLAELLMNYGVGSDNAVEKFSDGDIESLQAATNTNSRIFYLTFEVTIPAGQSIKIDCTMNKEAHIDFTGKNQDRNGYDMVTKLGSNLEFIEQRASISNTDKIEIIDQNFGFDIANDITEVTLDVNQEHYWMDIRRISDEK